jgi:hypothetical protein
VPVHPLSVVATDFILETVESGLLLANNNHAYTAGKETSNTNYSRSSFGSHSNLNNKAGGIAVARAKVTYHSCEHYVVDFGINRNHSEHVVVLPDRPYASYQHSEVVRGGGYEEDEDMFFASTQEDAQVMRSVTSAAQGLTGDGADLLRLHSLPWYYLVDWALVGYCFFFAGSTFYFIQGLASYETEVDLFPAEDGVIAACIFIVESSIYIYGWFVGRALLRIHKVKPLPWYTGKSALNRVTKHIYLFVHCV